jgi:cob(I)alamin adenosyltransferase
MHLRTAPEMPPGTGICRKCRGARPFRTGAWLRPSPTADWSSSTPGPEKGKTTAALGMVLRSLGHGYRVAIVQFIKGAWEPAEKRAFEPWGDQLQFHATGDGFTWETQDKVRDKLKAQAGWQIAEGYLKDPEFHLVLLDEINIALKKEYLSVEQVLSGIDLRPPKTHVVLTGRNAPDELIERADLVTEMNLIKHPLKLQRIRAQAGIEF